MPWPLQCQVPADALASSASSAGGFISAGAAPLSAAAAAFMSPAGLVSLGCATASPVIPTIATATLKNVFMIVLLWKNARTILKSVRETALALRESYGRAPIRRIHRDGRADRVW